MIMMRLLVGATRSIVWRKLVMAAELPMSSKLSLAALLRSITSRFSFDVSSARSRTRTADRP